MFVCQPCGQDFFLVESARAPLRRTISGHGSRSDWHDRRGPVEKPGEVAGLVALNELVIHGWDVARS